MEEVRTSSLLTWAVEVAVQKGLCDHVADRTWWEYRDLLDGPDNAEETCYAALLRMLRGH